jgi:hypothetical protein
MILLSKYVKFNVYSCYLEISHVHIRPNSNFLRVTEIAPTSTPTAEPQNIDCDNLSFSILNHLLEDF